MLCVSYTELLTRVKDALKAVGRKGIARLHPTGLKALAEPADALGGRAMRKGVGHDVPLRLTLDHIVADGAGCVEPLLDVALLEPVVDLVVEIGPHAREAIGLQFHADLQRIAIAFGHARLETLHLVGNAEQLLHVVSDLVRDYVCLGKVARRLETALELLVE